LQTKVEKNWILIIAKIIQQMNQQLTTNLKLLIALSSVIIFVGLSCKKTDTATTTNNKPKADFTFTIKNQGVLPDTVSFSSTATNATSLSWNFDNATTSTIASPQTVYTKTGTYSVKLIASNQYGADSITKPINIKLNKPVAGFNFTTSNLEVLPVTLTTLNTTTGSNVTYSWSFGNGTSTQTTPTNNFTSGGIYNIKLVATNASGSDSLTKQIRISPYPQAYNSINGLTLNLYAWEGTKVMILSRNENLNRASMFHWLKTMDSTYNYYKACTGREPNIHAPTYINNRTTIADVPNTCGAGCGYVGATGIELAFQFFDECYNEINTFNRHFHLCFYEFGRNFWFYGSKLDYKEAGSFPIAGAYAVFMSYMARDATGINPGPFAGMTYLQLVAQLTGLIDIYLASPSLNWGNTLAIDQGVPGTNTNAAGLFCSFLYRLRRDYGGENFVRNVWKQAGLRPNATTTQDAVDNFFLASCAAANKDLTTVFQSWRFPLSTSAITAASQYP
jgi:PKD repeat protein